MKLTSKVRSIHFRVSFCVLLCICIALSGAVFAAKAEPMFISLPAVEPIAAEENAEKPIPSVSVLEVGRALQEELAEFAESAEQEAQDGLPDDLVVFDTFIATAYCVTGTTSTGTYTTVGRTIAVNPYVIPYGTHLWLFLDDGTCIGDFYAEDTGSNMMANPYVIDIYKGAGSYEECIQWGAQHVTAYVSESEV